MKWLNAEILSIVLFFIGIYGICGRRNILKTIISLGIMQNAVILFFMTINFNHGKKPPIGIGTNNMADPLPQAMMITVIVIGIAVTAISLTMFITLYHKYGTTNWKKVIDKRRKQKS